MKHSPTPHLVLGLHGTAGAGKDTLFTRLHELHGQYARTAFADVLKLDLRPFILQHFGIDALTCKGAEKELIRPLLISYGMAKRMVDPLHWCKRATDQIMADWQARDEDYVPVVTDVRFENEVLHLRKTFQTFDLDSDTGGTFILVDVTRNGAPSPTDEEEKHYRQVAAMADYELTWGDDTPDQQRVHAEKLHRYIGGVMKTGW